MKIEALNCPNCGAAVSSDKTRCVFCKSRLKTMACASCLGLMFEGAKFCGHCGKRVIEAQSLPEKSLGSCPRCKIKLKLLQIEETFLRECDRCEGFWADVETFEEVCANHEKQAAILLSIEQNTHHLNPPKIRYVPCPECENLMNRSNFARSSGVIIDICKRHGVWFDAEELPKIIEFIRRGGLDRQREKEKLQLEEQRRNLTDLQRKAALQDSRFNQSYDQRNAPSTIAVREFIKMLFD
jgi:Zn-finger nucleic acid-binding protein